MNGSLNFSSVESALQTLDDRGTLVGAEGLSTFSVDDSRVTEQGGLIQVARSSFEVYCAIQHIARLGFFQFHAEVGRAQFVHRSEISQIWTAVLEGRNRVSDEGIVYKLIMPERPNVAKRLLIVLSGVPGKWNTPSLDRYFNYDYGYSERYRTRDTAVLRVADVGGVLGAFYRDTCDNAGNEEVVSGFIRRIMDDLQISAERCCILGTSKGGFGAVLHGLRLGIPFVANDPVVSDQYDSGGVDEYFLGRDVYPRRLQEDLDRAIVGARSRNHVSVFLTSPASAHFANIQAVASRVPGPKSVFVSRDPTVSKHSEVAGATLAVAVTAFNLILHGWDVPDGMQEI